MANLNSSQQVHSVETETKSSADHILQAQLASIGSSDVC